MQGVVDHNGFFQQVTCEWPGSTHDSFVLKSTPLWQFFEYQDRGLFAGSFILGDSGYPLRDWLMVPYISPVNFSQERYKRSLSRGRVIVEQAFGQLKRRFYINVSGYRLDLNTIPSCILACYVLHNIAKLMKLPDITDQDLEDILHGQPFLDDQPDPEIINEDESIIARNSHRSQISERQKFKLESRKELK